MKPHHQFIHLLKDQRGVSAIIVAIVLAVLIGFAALAIDIGYLYATRNELQNVADAAALAAAGQLGHVYTEMDIGDHSTYEYDPYDGDENDAAEQWIVGVAMDVGLKNQAARKDVIILENEVQVGQWKGDSNPDGFYLTNEQPNAVKVITRRDETVPTGRVTNFFAKILGINETAVTTKATASLSPPSGVAPGVLKVPVGLSIHHIEDCLETGIPPPVIHLSPTDTCAGWHNFFDAINASVMNDKLLGFIKSDPLPGEDCGVEGGPCGGQWFIDKFGWSQDDVDNLVPEVTPETTDDMDFEFQGGDIAALFTGAVLEWQQPGNVEPVLVDPEDPESDQVIDGNPANPAPIIALFDYFRFRDGDNDDSIWTTTIPIYEDEENCINPNTLLGLAGFTDIKVLNVNPPPGRTFDVEMDCVMKVIPSRSGSGIGLILGEIPNLVE